MKTKTTGSHGKVGVILALVLLIPIFLLAAVLIIFAPNRSSSSILTQELYEPLGSVTAARVDLDVGDGNLTVDTLTGGEPLLLGGTLQYTEKQGEPDRTLITFGEQAELTLKASSGGQPWLRLPWAACNSATEWLIHLNPGVRSAISAHTDGGNILLNLGRMALTSLSADTGGGSIDLVLPDGAANLSVTASTGAGNVTVDIGSSTGHSTINASSGAGDVTVRLPADLAARIHATTGLGEVIVAAGFEKVDDRTYQSPGYDSAADRVELTLDSGAGSVSISTK